MGPHRQQMDGQEDISKLIIPPTNGHYWEDQSETSSLTISPSTSIRNQSSPTCIPEGGMMQMVEREREKEEGPIQKDHVIKEMQDPSVIMRNSISTPSHYAQNAEDMPDIATIMMSVASKRARVMMEGAGMRDLDGGDGECDQLHVKSYHNGFESMQIQLNTPISSITPSPSHQMASFYTTNSSSHRPNQQHCPHGHYYSPYPPHPYQGLSSSSSASSSSSTTTPTSNGRPLEWIMETGRGPINGNAAISNISNIPTTTAHGTDHQLCQMFSSPPSSTPTHSHHHPHHHLHSSLHPPLALSHSAATIPSPFGFGMGPIPAQLQPLLALWQAQSCGNGNAPTSNGGGAVDLRNGYLPIPHPATATLPSPFLLPPYFGALFAAGPALPNASSKKCSNCGATSTPSWRRCPAGRALLCNACGLYQKLHNRPRPFRIAEDGSIRVQRHHPIQDQHSADQFDRQQQDQEREHGQQHVHGHGQEQEQSFNHHQSHQGSNFLNHHHHHPNGSPQTPKSCANCGTIDTPLWRRLGNAIYCNACALFRKTHNYHRPISTDGTTTGLAFKITEQHLCE